MDWTLLFIGSLVLLAIVSLLGFTGCSSLAEADPWPPDKKDPEPDPEPEVVYDDLVTLGEDGSAFLVGYWPLGEASGTVAEDRSNNDNHGTYVQGDGSLLQGQPGIVDSTTSTYFAGGAYVEVSNNPTTALGAFSAEAWVSFDGPTQEQEWYTVLDSSSQESGSDLRGFVVYAKHDLVSSVTQWAALVGNVGSGPIGVSVIGDAVVQGQPTHVGVSFDGSGVVLYVNGNPINASAAVVDNYLVPTGRPLTVGAGLHPDGSYEFKGWIQKVAVYDTALPQEHFAGHYAQLQTP